VEHQISGRTRTGLTENHEAWGLDLDQLGASRSIGRNCSIFVEGDEENDSWFMVTAGTVRVFKLFSDGRRHILEFYFPGELFFSSGLFSAEAVTAMHLIRYPKKATNSLLDDNPELARLVRERLQSDIVSFQVRNLRLGSSSAAERVAAFLLDVHHRCQFDRIVELPMSRLDIADYLGLTIETVCRILTSLKCKGIIAAVAPHHIELRDYRALARLGEV
jgi:CRP/FNR family transcriptional regulator